MLKLLDWLLIHLWVGLYNLFFLDPKEDMINPCLFSFRPQGVIFGRKAGGYLVRRATAEGHIIASGSSGSGKSYTFVKPTIRDWRYGLLATDIKGELAEEVKGQENVVVLNPLDPKSMKYDPFEVFEYSRNRVQAASEIARGIIPMREVKDPYWLRGAQRLLTGAILFFQAQGYSFVQVIDQLLTVPVNELVKQIHEPDTVGGQKNDARRFVNGFLTIKDEQLGGIYDTLVEHIMLFATDRDVIDFLDTSKGQQIRINDIITGQYKIFWSVPEYLLEHCSPLTTLFFEQVIKGLERRGDQKNNPFLIFLDECARMGLINSLESGMATLRNRGVAFVPVFQSNAQTEKIYGEVVRRILVDNSNYRLTLRAYDLKTQKEISESIGTMEQTVESRNLNYAQDGETVISSSVSESVVERSRVKHESLGLEGDYILQTPYGFYRVKPNRNRLKETFNRLKEWLRPRLDLDYWERRSRRLRAVLIVLGQMAQELGRALGQKFRHV